MKNLTPLTKKDLLDLAKVYNIVVNSKMTKQELIDLISPKHNTLSTSTQKTKTTSKSTSPKSVPTSKPVKKTETVSGSTTLKITPISKSAKKTESPSNSKKASKIKHPVQDMQIYFDNTITVLPQSGESVLIIWNADPSGDEHIKAWKIINDLGLDLLLPSYSRSLFVNIAILEKLDFHLYKIYQNNTQELFTEYSDTQMSFYKNTAHHSDTNRQDQLLNEHLASIALSSLSSSSNNFSNNNLSKLSSSSNNFSKLSSSSNNFKI